MTDKANKTFIYLLWNELGSHTPVNKKMKPSCVRFQINLSNFLKTKGKTKRGQEYFCMNKT